MCIPLGKQFPFPSSERSFFLPGPAYSPFGGSTESCKIWLLQDGSKKELGGVRRMGALFVAVVSFFSLFLLSASSIIRHVIRYVSCYLMTIGSQITHYVSHTLEEKTFLILAP